MSGQRNHVELIQQGPWLIPLHHPFGIRSGSEVCSMNNPCRLKPVSITSRIRHIVFMREKDEADAAHLFKRIHEMFDVARRIDQPLAAGMLQEIAVSAKRRRGVKSRVVEILVET